jgi:hypothetical protein
MKLIFSDRENDQYEHLNENSESSKDHFAYWKNLPNLRAEESYVLKFTLTLGVYDTTDQTETAIELGISDEFSVGLDVLECGDLFCPRVIAASCSNPWSQYNFSSSICSTRRSNFS